MNKYYKQINNRSISQANLGIIGLYLKTNMFSSSRGNFMINFF